MGIAGCSFLSGHAPKNLVKLGAITAEIEFDGASCLGSDRNCRTTGAKSVQRPALDDQ